MENSYPNEDTMSLSNIAKNPELQKSVIMERNKTEPYGLKIDSNRHWVTLVIAIICLAGLSLNLIVLGYILAKRLYKNFVSSHFIGHLCFTNITAFVFLLPVFLYNLWTGASLWEDKNFMCRVQALMTCGIWTVMHSMVTCVAGVHLLTFARIHYDQLFGLPPTMLCCLSWVIAFALGLPCITNGHVVIYDPATYHCIWGQSDSGLKFLAYVLILGVAIPTALTWYSYIRVLGILYHSPIVFQALGLYKSRFLVYAFILSPFYQLPFYIMTPYDRGDGAEIWPVVCMFVAYMQCIISPIFYGASLFLMKEEDMALTARAHKGATYQHPGIPAQEL